MKNAITFRFASTLLLFSLLVGCRDPTVTNSPALPLQMSRDQNPAPLNISAMSVTMFSTAFAERFGYDSNLAYPDLDQQIHALQFLVERNVKVSPEIYECNLKVYINSESEIEYPEDNAISNRQAVNGFHFFYENVTRWSEEDRRVFVDRNNSYNSVAFFAHNKNGKGNFATRSLQFLEHHKSLLAGMDYYKVGTGCFLATSDNELHTSDIELWLKKSGDQGAANSLDLSPEAYVRFDIPKIFLDQAADLMLAARSRNQ